MSASALRRSLPRARPPCRFPPPAAIRTLHTTSPSPATLLPITAHGPPPQPPTPSPASTITAFRQRQKLFAPSKRFWKTVHVVPDAAGYTINLDRRVLKTPSKAPLLIPRSKPLLAYALALEWSNLHTSGEATKPHLVPLTQMAARAVDMQPDVRSSVEENLLRYLDTDTVLCVAPSAAAELRSAQEESAATIVGALSRGMWEGVELSLLDGDLGFALGRQEEATRERLRIWMEGLDVWTLIGFERIVLAAKSFVIGGRMVAEWGTVGGEGKWGVEEAAQAASLEVAHQTRQWGEVEDTHDVEKEDIRRQIGAGWLMIVEGDKTGGDLV